MLHLQTLIDHFQKRWKSEYLNELREHQCCNNSSPTKRVKIGDVVLVEDKKLPRLKWRLGLVTSLLQSKDGYVRGCQLRVYDGKNSYIYLRRPINQLCYFEVRTEESIKHPTSEKSDIVEKTNDLSKNVERITRPRRKAAARGELNRVLSKQL